MLLGYGEGGKYGAGRGELQLPHDVVASEFLTMEGKQFSSSRSVAIYVRDFLEPVRRGCAALLHRGACRRRRTGTSRERSSFAATTTSWSQRGATWSTG